MWVLAMAGCLVGAATAEPPVAWEYGTILVLRDNTRVVMAIETPTGDSLPVGADRSSLPLVLGPEDGKFRNLSAALSHAGAQGWEVVTSLGEGRFLVKRRK